MQQQQSTMTTEEWFKQSLEDLKNDPEFLFEEAISLITNKICKIMEDHKINRTQLANKLEISPPAVTRMLDGNPNFTVKRLVAVANALDQDLIIDFRPRTIPAVQDMPSGTIKSRINQPSLLTAGESGTNTPSQSETLQSDETFLPTAKSQQRHIATVSAA
jgi:transcriptional regulator with XRE-family HTH domain